MKGIDGKSNWITNHANVDNVRWSEYATHVSKAEMKQIKEWIGDIHKFTDILNSMKIGNWNLYIKKDAQGGII